MIKSVASIIVLSRFCLAPAEQNAVCDFTIYYNRWIATFEPRDYESNGAAGGAHCLEACCRDPSCHGLALQSSLESQCYKYVRAPHVSDESPSPLAEFLAAERVSQWSIFIKHVHQAPVGPSLPLLTAPVSQSLQHAVATRPRPLAGMVSEESALDKKLRGVDPAHSGYHSRCEWTVFYNTWMPSFVHGEYTHDETGGPSAHCLQKCCEDATCKGLTLESSELYQCYKYEQLPQGLNMHEGKRLGNGRWLSKQRKAWSIFAKSAHAVGLPKSQQNASSVESGANVTALVSSVGETSASANTLLSDENVSKLRWLMFSLVLMSLFGLVADSVSATLRKRATTLELKVCTRASTEQSPLMSSHEAASRAAYLASY